MLDITPCGYHYSEYSIQSRGHQTIRNVPSSLANSSLCHKIDSYVGMYSISHQGSSA